MSIEALFPSMLDRSPNVEVPAPRQRQAAGDAYDLEAAVIFARLGELKTLLERGVSATTPDQEGYLLLSFAVVRGNTEVLRLLLEHGADPLKTDAGGLCPLELAHELEHEEVVRLLLDHLGVQARPLDTHAV